MPDTPTGLEQVQALLAAGQQPPFGEKLGIELVEADHGHAVFEATPDISSYNPMGTVHGVSLPRCWIARAALPFTPLCDLGLALQRWN